VKKIAFCLFAVAALSLVAEPAQAGIFSRLFGRRSAGCSSCGPTGCGPGGCSVGRAMPTAPQRSGCYTLPGGVRVCPVR
jgi:hypothetical protein